MVKPIKTLKDLPTTPFIIDQLWMENLQSCTIVRFHVHQTNQTYSTTNPRIIRRFQTLIQFGQPEETVPIEAKIERTRQPTGQYYYDITLNYIELPEEMISYHEPC